LNINASEALNDYTYLDYSDFSLYEEQVNVLKSETKRNRHVRHANNSQSEFLQTPYLKTNRFSFAAFGRKFLLYLKHDVDLIGTNNIEIEIRSDKAPSVHLKDKFSMNYYSGFVENEERSHVVLYYEKQKNHENFTQANVMDALPIIFAQISIENKTDTTYYYIETVFDSQETMAKYLIYRSSDINSNVMPNGLFNQTVCKPKYINQTMDEEQIKTEEEKKKTKRNIQDGTRSNTRTRCALALVADHKFFKEIGNSNIKLTTAYLMNVIAGINSVYTRTVWNLYSYDDESNGLNTDQMSNYGFTIDKIIILKEATSFNGNNHYNNMNSSKSADQVLELFGEENWTKYCLAHLFTYQSFENGVLGLAYVSSPLKYSVGGICSSSLRSRYPRELSVNIGLSSYKSTSLRQGRLLQREAELVTAHEFGHNWGSEHDPLKPECAPGSKDGNYIMYPYANQGIERNNYYFSPCSINYISEVLKTKSHCFTGESLSYCGNDRVEANEECDAGPDGRQGLDKCCDENCKLRPTAQCSDSNHYCCENCRIAQAGFKCYSSSNYIECFDEHSFCDGINKECPSQAPKRQNTPCNSHDSGQCDGRGRCLSLCEQKDKSFYPCKCQTDEHKCMICCRHIFSNVSMECKPIHQLFGSIAEPIYLSNGRACFDGHCENVSNSIYSLIRSQFYFIYSFSNREFACNE
jgi:disintegrin and metalloproteinase domain-containing protein 17